MIQEAETDYVQHRPRQHRLGGRSSTSRTRRRHMYAYFMTCVSATGTDFQCREFCQHWNMVRTGSHNGGYLCMYPEPTTALRYNRKYLDQHKPQIPKQDQLGQ